MVVVSSATRYVTAAGREFVTHLPLDELLEFWRTKYDTIFAQECRNRRLWATTVRAGGQAKALGQVEAEIERRQKEWDAYVREQLADLATATAQ